MLSLNRRFHFEAKLIRLSLHADVHIPMNLKRTQEAKLEGRRQRLKRYEDYLKGSSSAADPERDEINDLLNRHVHHLGVLLSVNTFVSNTYAVKFVVALYSAPYLATRHGTSGFLFHWEQPIWCVLHKA